MRAHLSDLARSAKPRETGGVVMGEALPDGGFRVAAVSVAASPGGRASFVRSERAAARAMANFFETTGNEFAKFNYLGEWHSHPGFSPEPSNQDTRTMGALVSAEDFAGNFAVLLIVAIDGADETSFTATVFPRVDSYFRATLIFEEDAP